MKLDEFKMLVDLLLLLATVLKLPAIFIGGIIFLVVRGLFHSLIMMMYWIANQHPKD